MHNIKRQTATALTASLPSSAITRPASGEQTATASVITADGGAQSALTSITRTVQEGVTQPASTFTTTFVQTIAVTDSAEFLSLQASQASESRSKAGATQTEAKTSAPASQTSTAGTSSSSSSSLSTLIPAIVVPVAIVLLTSFAVFWFLMRRRHQRKLKEEPEFVMASKAEKPISRDNSHSSGHSSTRELVSMSKLEKEMAVNTSELQRPSPDLFPPTYSAAAIGLARPMTPPDTSETNAGSTPKKSIPNFSSVRPSMSHRLRLSQASGIGVYDQSTSTPSMSHSEHRSSPPKTSRGPSPTMRGPARAQPQRLPFSHETDATPSARSPPRPKPAPLSTTMSNGNRAAPPTPTGAFNGLSSISQYSPIARDHPSVGGVVTPNLRQRPDQPASIRTPKLPLPLAGRTVSPVGDNALSDENVTIGRIANSSRINTTTRTLSPLVGNHPKLEATAASPELPPPLSREGLPPNPFTRVPDSPSAGSSIYPSPSIGPGATPMMGESYSPTSLLHGDRIAGTSSSTGMPYRASVISRISSDDGYVDMELDAKSDVSSLDEREKWELESERREASSRLEARHEGSRYGNAGRSPTDESTVSSSAATAAGAGQSKPNLRDRDSEGPFVLSRY